MAKQPNKPAAPQPVADTVAQIRLRTRAQPISEGAPEAVSSQAPATDQAPVPTRPQRPAGKSRDTSGDYEVGYKRPPKSAQFKKGQSGNPKGRPKASRNIRTMAMEILLKRREVTVDGKKASLSQMEIGLQQMMNNYMKGDARAGRRCCNSSASCRNWMPRSRPAQHSRVRCPR